MLGHINLSLLSIGPRGAGRVVGDTLDCLTGETVLSTCNGYVRCPDGAKVDWVICGGESGHNARPILSLVDQMTTGGRDDRQRGHPVA